MLLAGFGGSAGCEADNPAVGSAALREGRLSRRPLPEPIAERCRSGRSGRSRKPLCPLLGTEGSNPSLSAISSFAIIRQPSEIHVDRIRRYRPSPTGIPQAG